MTEALHKAAQAVLDRWDSPQWEWRQHGPTADLMADLRAALAQPAAPDVTPEDAHPMYQLGWKAGYKHGAWSDKPAPDAQPDKWEGAEEWMPLAWELCAEECGEEACTELVWEGGPIPEPWGDRWLKYEDEAKRLIALVRKCTAGAALAQPAAPDAQPVAWLGGDGHPRHISAVQTITERRIYGPRQPLYAAPQAVPVPAWQPIETAPRGSGEDGPKMVNDPDYVAPPELLLMTPDGMTVGAYDWYYHAGYGRGAEPGVPAWRQSLSSEPIYDATHWMPLPPAPGAAQAAQPAPQPLSDAANAALAEVEKATRKFPTWPTDPLHALAVLGEEFGELTKDVLQMVYEPHKTNRDRIRTECVQTAAMALRFMASLDRYEYRPGEQHSQGGITAAPTTDKGQG